MERSNKKQIKRNRSITQSQCMLLDQRLGQRWLGQRLTAAGADELIRIIALSATESSDKSG